MSTAFERIMRARGDCTCRHEPFLYDYYVARSVRDFPHFDPDPSRPQRYEDIRDDLLRAAAERPVFFKDMSYYVVPRIFEDRTFALALTNVFLIRDPRLSIPSYYRLDPDLTREEVGLEAQAQHLAWLEAETGQTPMVIEAEAMQRRIRNKPCKGFGPMSACRQSLKPWNGRTRACQRTGPTLPAGTAPSRRAREFDRRPAKKTSSTHLKPSPNKPLAFQTYWPGTNPPTGTYKDSPVNRPNHGVTRPSIDLAFGSQRHERASHIKSRPR